MIGKDISSITKPNEKHGYLFVIDGKDIKDIQPDEDNIGEFIYNAFDNNYAKTNNLYWLIRLASKYLTPLQLRNVKFGEYNEWAHAGKKLMKYFTDEQKLQLIDLGAHIVYAGAIIPKECWRIDKLDSIKLKEDGSNFFEIATMIKSKEEIIWWILKNIILKNQI